MGKFVPSESSKNKTWKKSFFARDKTGVMYTAMRNDETKEMFYSHPTKPYLYDSSGQLIGYRGSDNQAHFGAPKKGWGSNKEKIKKAENVGPIVNKYLGTGTGTMAQLGTYSDVISPLSKTTGPEDIRRPKTEDAIMQVLKEIDKPSF